jgi:hypothetical protein
MKLQRTFIYIAGVFFAVGFAASPAVAGTGPDQCSAVFGPDAPEMIIEVNALRAGGKTIVTTRNATTKVTAKARILKGTAPSGTTIDTTLTIESFDGAVKMGQAATSMKAITLGVGKGGKGATLLLPTNQCDSGGISFVATFFGVDDDNFPCEGTKTIHKLCQ